MSNRQDMQTERCTGAGAVVGDSDSQARPSSASLLPMNLVKFIGMCALAILLGACGSLPVEPADIVVLKSGG